MTEEPLTPAQVRRSLALIEKGHQLEGKQPDAESLDRARRVLAGELSADDAREEMTRALQSLASREKGPGLATE